MKNQLSTLGYNFQMVSLNEWTLDDGKNPTYQGSFAQVMAYANLKHDFNMDDLAAGVELMLAQDADGIHFGMFKTVMFATKKVA